MSEESKPRHWRDKPVEKGWFVESSAIVWLPMTVEEAEDLLEVMGHQPFNEQGRIRSRLNKRVKEVLNGG